MRRLVRETHLEPSQLVLPLFVCPGEGVRNDISSMPGQAQLSIDLLVKECQSVHALGVGGVILFGIPETKDEEASGAYADDGITQRAVRAVKRAVPGLIVMTDVCNCEYTSHGHCGKIVGGEVDNDATMEWLAKTAVSHARPGADSGQPPTDPARSVPRRPGGHGLRGGHGQPGERDRRREGASRRVSYAHGGVGRGRREGVQADPARRIRRDGDAPELQGRQREGDGDHHAQ